MTSSNGPPHFEYHDGALSWGTTKLLDENIICVTTDHSQSTIFSLTATEEGSQKQFELQITNTTSLPPEFLNRHLLKGLPAYLHPDDNVIHVLISTLSGTGLAPSFFDDVLHPVLLGIGLLDSSYHVLRTENTNSVAEFAKATLLPAAAAGKKQTVLILSGDGGLVDTVNGILEEGNPPSTYRRPVLAQLPLGTGNALFHSLHKPTSAGVPSLYIQGLRTLLHGTPRPLPIFRATFSPSARLLTNEARTASPLKNNTLYGAVVASYGLHSTLVADSDTTEYRKHGDKRFGLVANDLLFPDDGTRPHAYLAEVVLSYDGHKDTVPRGEHGYVLATLVSNLEKTFTISPESAPFDRALRVVHFGALSGEETMEIMKAAYDDGKHVQSDEVGYENVESMRINFKESGESWKWRRCCVDGSIVGVEEGGWMEVSLLGSGEEVVDVVADP
ncbi:uncharacterized protein LY89DRAFT_621164 [Mollisia scopiformis]|uniref:DAGKc domain-containing protein n=1 Tax=Mollisia scopiformis TaxID=149040 RepID=A0A194X3J7_MOLSC|nr:uncharacterized protein LY89DRAFT_621164 [Mollisia scopiformis]KUJ14599.1 hypothetical protein LY89DRAFT_621164 [Mollisia scopiformis]